MSTVLQRSVLVGVLVLAVTGPACAAAASEVLAALRDASGGPGWGSIDSIVADGTIISFGLTGTWRSVEDLRDGRFAWASRFEEFGNAEGIDALGRWRQDNSGQVHGLDSPAADTTTASERYLVRRGYLRSEGVSVTVGGADASFEVLDVTPSAGRPVRLWIDAKTHLLARFEIELGHRTKRVDFSDYRAVDGVRLPFRIRVDDGDEVDSGEIAIRAYGLNVAPDAVTTARPRPPSDTRILGGSDSTQTTLALDPHSGFPIVHADINGHGSYAFIIDTGGHDILTPICAARLGLHLSGKGMSTGAGAGTTSTSYARVARLRVGEVELVGQPFLVLDADLGTTSVAGRSEPIAGILGLEFFERFVVQLDFPSNTMRLHTHAAAHDIALKVPIRFTSDMPLVEARIDGRHGWFGVDTGNNVGLIVFEHFTTALGGSGGTQAVTDGESVGGMVQFRSGRAQDFAIGSIGLGAQKFMIPVGNTGSLSDRDEAGNVGVGLLDRGVWTFNYRSETISYQTPVATP